MYPIEGKVFIDIIIEQTKAICSVKPNTEELIKNQKKTVMLESTIYNKQQLHEPIFWQL